MAERERFLDVHERLLRAYDVEGWHWRDTSSPDYICIGAILVQHTSWGNVELALANLDAAGVCTLAQVLKLPEEELALLARPAGTPLTKARRLQTLAAVVRDRGGFAGLSTMSEAELRARLLSTPGIGPETADAILLYALGKAVVVNDAYTQHIFRRVGMGPARDRYDDWRAWLAALLPPDLQARRDNHAAIVLHGKTLCRPRPLCDICPLMEVCDFGRARRDGSQ